MTRVRALVAAAGRGTRAGLPFPKTLFPLQGRPILLRILDVLYPYDPTPVVVVSPAGLEPVAQCLATAGRAAELVVQPEPRGMGDAVLKFEQASDAALAEHVLLVWGDIPFLQPETVRGTVQRHLEHGNDFTFATREVESAYTVVSRDEHGQVAGVRETRESATAPPTSGERDIGLFIFRRELVLTALHEDLPNKWGATTGEHGFLYLIEHLAHRHFRIEAVRIATEHDLVSLNSLQDVRDYV
jgi:bifunctional UDP-N-acetylglucosamine pyrophosphorylase/glucosamine-1-phosphate N-acetyltransferase